jgi:hypothetical protein
MHILSMTLGEWMQIHGLGDDDVAALTRRDRSNVSKLRRQKTKPSWKLASILQVISDGAVTANDWMPPPPKWAKPLKRAA